MSFISEKFELLFSQLFEEYIAVIYFALLDVNFGIFCYSMYHKGLYFTFSWSMLEYGSTIWSYFSDLISRIESIQRHFFMFAYI